MELAQLAAKPGLELVRAVNLAAHLVQVGKIMAEH